MKFITLKPALIVAALLCIIIPANAQDHRATDSLYIEHEENKELPIKVLHAEPLYIDLIRDLGARRGEREWNVGMGLTDKDTYDEYTALVEYEWAPADRLGLEVELPFSLHYPVKGHNNAPGNKLNSLKVAGQYSFFVSEKISTSMAIGYIHEFELTDFAGYDSRQLVTGNVYNPFFIAAKRWGQNFHTLLYTGPQFVHHFDDNATHTVWQVNSNVHYMIPGTRNFVGIEFNKEFQDGDFDMTIRPQMRVGIADNLLIGIVTGVPVNRENERFSTFLRLIYEPGH
ncbi:HAEPLYID family protein [uncultured Flavobacterium sp.]|uniref:HAEPLYID family protein n=1 Tax=uncultured Flavobacterium sp. TaxID=165435 RepID=UPI0025DA8702|nr:HAEPLYID family protein [uncultured Flavobacterium sp.]